MNNILLKGMFLRGIGSTFLSNGLSDSLSLRKIPLPMYKLRFVIYFLDSYLGFQNQGKLVHRKIFT